MNAYLRNATDADVDLLYRWVNEDNVRKNSFSTDFVSYKSHQEWFNKIMNNKDEKIFIFCVNGHPIGQIRVSMKATVAVVVYSIAVQYRLRGYGKMMLLLLERKLKDVYPYVTQIRAEVKPNNVASIKVFETLNYDEKYLIFEKNIEDATKETSEEMENTNSVEEGVILFLTNNRNTLKLTQKIEKTRFKIRVFSDKVEKEQIMDLKPKLIISYNYRYIIHKEVIQCMHGHIINLHISLLPWNRGANPNFWSFYENTPKGVTIHLVDEHLDTGDIIFQKECDFDVQEETFASSYDRLQNEIQELLLEHLEDIIEWKVFPRKQIGQGTYHIGKDLEMLKKTVGFNWNENIVDVIQRMKNR